MGLIGDHMPTRLEVCYACRTPTCEPPMSWTHLPEYKQLSYELTHAQADAFTAQVKLLLRLVWPERDIAYPSAENIPLGPTGVAPHLRSPQGSLSTWIFCFVFARDELAEEEASQVRNKLRGLLEQDESIGICLFIHNRDGRSKQFRASLAQDFEALQHAGRVGEIHLWDRQMLLAKAFDALTERAREALAAPARRVTEEPADTDPPLPCEPLSEVPLQRSELLISTYRLLRQQPCGDPSVRDPAQEILSWGRITVLIGQAGYGKTTTAQRATDMANRVVLYVPAALLSARNPGGVLDTKGLLAQCAVLTKLLPAGGSPEEEALQQRMARGVVQRLLGQETTPCALLLDGLDESFFFRVSAGFQHLFNLLRDIRVPVILTARTEYWVQKLADFQIAIQATAAAAQKQSWVQLVELLPWQDDQILALSKRYRSVLPDSAERRHVERFVELVAKGEYALHYGDIPRRPLFLRLILETVAERGVHTVSRAQLYLEWAETKVLRDLRRPERIPLQGTLETIDQRLKLAFRAMAWAAHLMTTEHQGAIVFFRESCRLDTLQSAHPSFTELDPIGLPLHSLLIPAPGSSLSAPLAICFAHRTYQEFFLAYFYRHYPEHRPALPLPEAVQAWLDEIEAGAGKPASLAPTSAPRGEAEPELAEPTASPGTALIRLPPGVSWTQISFREFDGVSYSIYSGKQMIGRLNSTELKLNAHNERPTIAWHVLRWLGEHPAEPFSAAIDLKNAKRGRGWETIGRRYDVNHHKDHVERAKQWISQLRDCLKVAFGLNEDPFERARPNELGWTCWQPKFRVHHSSK